MAAGRRDASARPARWSRLRVWLAALAGAGVAALAGTAVAFGAGAGGAGGSAEACGRASAVGAGDPLEPSHRTPASPGCGARAAHNDAPALALVAAATDVSALQEGLRGVEETVGLVTGRRFRRAARGEGRVAERKGENAFVVCDADEARALGVALRASRAAVVVFALSERAAAAAQAAAAHVAVGEVDAATVPGAAYAFRRARAAGAAALGGATCEGAPDSAAALAEALFQELGGHELDAEGRVVGHVARGGCGSPGGKARAACAEGGDKVLVTVVVQYFRRPANVAPILKSLRDSMRGTAWEMLVNVDSGWGGAGADGWLDGEYRTGERATVVLSNDVHELRAYNRLAAAASAELVVLAQDDDAPLPGSLWLQDAMVLFATHPKMGMLGAYRGRMDDGSRMKESGQNDGSKFGAGHEKDRETRPITHQDAATGAPFMWVYKVNMGPLLVRRTLFLALGGFNLNFSCAGEMGQGFDFEYSVRLWREGWRVGLYDGGWEHRIDAHENHTLGNKARHRDLQDASALARKDAATTRNNRYIYDAYGDFHHRPGCDLAKRALREDVDAGRLVCGLPGHAVCGRRFHAPGVWEGSETCVDVRCVREALGGRVAERGAWRDKSLSAAEKRALHVQNEASKAAWKAAEARIAREHAAVRAYHAAAARARGRARVLS